VPALPRFPSLAAFERRPGDLGARGELSDGAGIRNPSQKLPFQHHALASSGDQQFYVSLPGFLLI
jgi:hypothetical protein